MREVSAELKTDNVCAQELDNRSQVLVSFATVLIL